MAEKTLSILRYFLHGLNVLTVGLISLTINLLLLLIFSITCFCLIVLLVFALAVSFISSICILITPFLFVGFGSVTCSPTFLFAGFSLITAFLGFGAFRMVILNMICYPIGKFLPLVMDCAEKSTLHMKRIILLSINLINTPYKYLKKQINKIGNNNTQIEKFNNIKAKFDLKETPPCKDDFKIGITKTEENIIPLVRTKSLDFDHMRKLSNCNSVK